MPRRQPLERLHPLRRQSFGDVYPYRPDAEIDEAASDRHYWHAGNASKSYLKLTVAAARVSREQILNSRRTDASGTRSPVVSILVRETINLPSRRRKRVLYRRLDMLMARIANRCVIDHNACVRWNCEPDVDLEARAVPMLAAGSNHSHAACGDAAVVCFQPLYFIGNCGVRGVRRS